jgi:uncharacterized membrane protein YfcA
MYVFLAILIGFFSAFLAAMFGIGGAFLTTPSIRLLLDASPAISLGTPLPVTIPTAITGAITYGRRGFVDKRVACLSALAGVFGSISGALLTKILNLHYLMLLTGVLILYVSGQMIRRAAAGEALPAVTEASLDIENDSPVKGSPSKPAWIALLIGLGAGFLSGLLGVGGGIVLVPGFVFLLKLPLKKAFGTSLAVIAVLAIPGTIIHAYLGHISWSLVLYLTIGVIPGAYLGARTSIRTGERVLFTLFGVLIGVFGVIFIVNEIISMVG